MNDLQLGLIGLGVVAVAGVFAYNKWQERRHRRLAETVLQRGHEDVLMGGAAAAPEETVAAPRDDVELPAYQRRREPVRISTPDDPVPGETGEPVPFPVPAPAAPVEEEYREPEAERQEPVLVEHVEAVPGERIEPAIHGDPRGIDAFAGARESLPPPVEAPAPLGADLSDPGVADVACDVPPALVSPSIDYVAAFELVEAVSGDRLLNAQRDLLDRVTKPVNWAGYNDKTREWEQMVEFGDYRRFRVGLQLADRRGPLGEADLLTFYGAMQDLAEEFMAVADLPPRQEALDAAIALDHFCANVDIQIGINLVSHGATFPGTKIRALAEAAGLGLEQDGRFVRRNDDGHILYTLSNLEATVFSAESMKTLSTHALVFLLDVPCVDHGDRVFAQMLDVARRMADTLKGVLVDDNRRPLTEAMLDPFRRQIGQYQTQLAAKGLPAGGPLALRVFT